MRILLWLSDQMTCNRVIPDVLPDLTACLSIKNTYFGKTFLPNWRVHPKLPPCPKSKTSFDKLHSALDR